MHRGLNQGLHAQVVHIDLGIAFEQGRFLNTPELVPFRLTRDVVDGMGAAGDSLSATYTVVSLVIVWISAGVLCFVLV